MQNKNRGEKIIKRRGETAPHLTGARLHLRRRLGETESLLNDGVGQTLFKPSPQFLDYLRQIDLF